MAKEVVIAASVGGAAFVLLVVFVVLVICCRLRKKHNYSSRTDFRNNVAGTHYVHNSISNASVKALDLSQNPISANKSSQLSNYTLNVTNNFTSNALAGNELKADINDNKGKVHTISDTSVVATDMGSLEQEQRDEYKETEVKLMLKNDNQVKSVKNNQNALKVNENAHQNDDELIAFTEESLKVFEQTGLTKEENKIIEALEDTLSGYVNAAFDETGDPLDGENVETEITRPDSRASNTSNQSSSDKPGIIVTRRDSDIRKLKRPNSVSFQLPDNHVDKQTNGQYNTRTLPVSGRAQGYKRVLASKFYSYRPNTYSAWSTRDLPRNFEAKERPTVQRTTESLSKKTIGPFNASFSELLRKKPKESDKLNAVQNGSAKMETHVKLNLPTHTKKRATILDDTTKLLSKLEVDGGTRHLNNDYKLKDQPYIVQEIGSSPGDESSKGDKFLY